MFLPAGIRRLIILRSDIVITATYTEITGAYLSCDAQSVDKDASITIPVRLLNCKEPVKAFGISIVDDSGSFTVTRGAWSSDFDYEISNFNKNAPAGCCCLDGADLGKRRNIQYNAEASQYRRIGNAYGHGHS